MKSVFIKVLRVLMLFIVIISCAVGYVVYEDTLAELVDTCRSGFE